MYTSELCFQTILTSHIENILLDSTLRVSTNFHFVALVELRVTLVRLSVAWIATIYPQYKCRTYFPNSGPELHGSCSCYHGVLDQLEPNGLASNDGMGGEGMWLLLWKMGDIPVGEATCINILPTLHIPSSADSYWKLFIWDISAWNDRTVRS